MTYDPYEGFTRKQYLTGLAEDFGIDEDIVFGIASLLGKSEDFDGLISALEDYADQHCYD